MFRGMRKIITHSGGLLKKEREREQIHPVYLIHIPYRERFISA